MAKRNTIEKPIEIKDEDAQNAIQTYANQKFNHGIVVGATITSLIATFGIAIKQGVKRQSGLNDAISCVESEVYVQNSKGWVGPKRSEEAIITQCAESRTEAQAVREHRIENPTMNAVQAGSK